MNDGRRPVSPPIAFLYRIPELRGVDMILPICRSDMLILRFLSA